MQIPKLRPIDDWIVIDSTSTDTAWIPIDSTLSGYYIRMRFEGDENDSISCYITMYNHQDSTVHTGVILKEPVKVDQSYKIAPVDYLFAGMFILYLIFKASKKIVDCLVIERLKDIESLKK